MFSRKKAAPELTNDVYQWWLEAQRPPFEWFLRLSKIEQETLANIGVAHSQDLALAVGHAVQDPDGSADSRDARAGDPAAEESLIRRIAGTFVEKIQASRAPQQAPEPAQEWPPRESLAGAGERRKETHERKGRAPAKLFGQAPDEAVAP
tara:strand:- start:21760 stop:22209 length:450 start_codon:yes stop_codon:yes gene_type:complete